MRACQLFVRKQQRASFSFKLTVVEAPFQKWCLNFIGEFKENSNNGFKWIITATNYFRRWVESIPTKKVTNKVVMEFLEDKIITRFGIPTKIMTDNGKAFNSEEL